MEANRLRHLFPTWLSTPASLPPIIPFNSALNSSLPYYYYSSTAASDSTRCSSRRPDVRKPNWDATGTERSKFYPYTELYGNDEDEDDGDGGFFEFGESKKHRKWWSDDEEDGEEDEFWGFKILKVFGWMVPAILISMVLGNGPNALFMAVALPLGQTALSLAVDKVCEMTTQPPRLRPRPRNRPKSKPFASSSNTNRARKRKRKQDADFVGSKERESSPSNTNYHEPAQGNGHRASTSFGGWDELDREVEMKPDMEEVELKRQKNSSKVTRRLRNRDSPLLMRLLVSVFPFLGSWARFLF